MRNNIKELEDLLEEMVNDINYYKNIKNYSSIIDFIKMVLYDEKNFTYNVLLSILKDIRSKKIDTDSVDQKKLNDLIAKVWSFYITNEKNFINKTKDNKWTIYEYEEYYIIFLNDKKIDLKKEIEKIFPNKKLISIYIDNISRKNYEPEDIRMSEKVKIKISKY